MHDVKQFYRRSVWRLWEYTLIVTGWVFGYGHPTYYGVKASRNMAYFRYTLHDNPNKKVK